MACLVAIDQSTSATKALLFEADGRLLDRESLEHRQYYPRPGWVEHDAEEIWQNTRTTLGTLLGRHADRVGEIAGLSLTNQRETIVVFERDSGRPLHPAIVWQCRRSEAICAAEVAAGQESWVRAKTGLKIDPYFSGSKLSWLVRERPKLRAKLASGEALIGTIDTYLIHRMTCGAVFATDPTNASRTLLFDIGRLQWDEQLAGLWGVPRRALPEVRESFAHFGETTLAGVLPRPIPICGVMGDSQAALWAHGCDEPGLAKVTFGTGSSILLNIGSQLRLSDRGLVTALAWVRGGVPVYAFEGIIISAASTLTWLRDQLGVVDSLDGIEALATAVPDAGGVHVVPAFSGLGFPHWAPAARAAITGLSPHSDRRHVVRAALEAIAFQLDDAFAALRADSPVPVREVHGDGGPTANRFLMQFTADVTATCLLVAPIAECSALGAVKAGAEGLGLAGSGRQGDVPPPVTYTPRMNPDQVARLRAGWHHAVAQTILPRGTPHP